MPDLALPVGLRRLPATPHVGVGVLRLPAVGTLKGYSKALEYEYRVKTPALGTLK
jgi:hypothetical protein